jgi:hypothetical protein
MIMDTKETYNCSICNTEINTAEMKMMIDRDENLKIRGTLCVECYAAVRRDDPLILLKAAEYILMGGCPEMFEDDGEVPRRRKIRRGLSEQDRDLLEQLTGKREFKTLRDEEFSIPKLKGRRKAAPKKKKQPQKSGSGKGSTGSATKWEQPESTEIELAA